MSNSQKHPIKHPATVFKFTSAYDEPKWTIKRGKDWIEFGHDNLAFDYIDGLLDASPIHAGIVNGLIQFVIGEGLIPPTDPKALAFYTNGETSRSSSNNLGEVVKRMARDLVMYGGSVINPIWRHDSTSYSSIEYVEARSMRMDSEYEGGWISADWANPKKEPNIPSFFPFYSDEQRTGSQLLYVRLPNARRTPMALPHYWSVRSYVEAQGELISLHLNRLRNAYLPSVLIRFDSVPSPEEQDLNYNMLNDFFAGSKNSGKAGILYGDGVNFEKFESSDVPKGLELLEKNVTSMVKIGHRVTGRGDLFGINDGTSGTFSSNDDLLNEFETYSRTVVQPIQWAITDALQMLSDAAGIQHQWEIKPFVLFPAKNPNSLLP